MQDFEINTFILNSTYNLASSDKHIIINYKMHLACCMHIHVETFLKVDAF